MAANNEMDLFESVNTAIEKMQNASHAYEWLRRNIHTSDTQEQTKQFDLLKEINTVPDILFRCYVLEKNIHYPGGNVKLLSTDCYSKSLMGAILVHNQLNPSNKYLTDVDFACFFDDSKTARNFNVHVGVRGVLYDVYRIFENLNKVLLDLEINQERRTVHVAKPDTVFDYPRFEACMDSWNVDERRYILITESLHDVNKTELAAFLSIPWSMIIDFDAASLYGGIRNVMNDAGLLYNSHLITDFTSNTSIAHQYDHILHVALENDNALKDKFFANKMRSIPNESAFLGRAIEIIRNTREKATIVVVGSYSIRVDAIIKAIADHFVESDIIILNKQSDNTNVIAETDPDDYYAVGNISNVAVFEDSIYDVFNKIHLEKDSLPARAQLQLTDGFIYIVNVPSVGKVGISDADSVNDVEQYFEFVHEAIGSDESINEDEFFHGDIANWATIRNGNIPVLKDYDAFKKTIKSGGSNKVYYIYHSPGIGGSTLGRQLCYDLSKEYPVLIMRRFDSALKLASLINLLYSNSFFKKSQFYILVDENDFTEREFQDIKTTIETSDSHVSGIFVKRITEGDARKHYLKPAERELLFTQLSSDKRDLLMARCYQILKNRGEEIRFESRKTSLEENIGTKDRYALMINLYLLEEDFKLETYINGFLKGIPNDFDGSKIKDILIFTSIGEYFANVQFPISYLSHYYSLIEAKDLINESSRKSKLENILQPYEDGLLLKKSINEVKFYGVKHYLIAEEILKQLLATGAGENWMSSIPMYSKKIIDMFISISTGRDSIDSIIMSILTALYTDKTRDRQVRTNSEFTAMLDSVDGPAKIDIMLYVASKYSELICSSIASKSHKPEYKFLAHIYAQCARIRSKYCLLDENTINEEEVENWIEKTDDLIYAEEIFEYDLEDMLGRCYLDRIRNDEMVYFDESEKDKALQNVDSAIDHFNKTIWYGSPDYGIPGKLESLRHGLEILKKWNSWSDDRLIEKIMEDVKAKEYFHLGNDLIREFDEYIDISTVGQVKSFEQKSYFESFYCSGEKSTLIRDLENLSAKVDKADYHSQYVISSGIFNGYESIYSSEGDSRSQLIRKALSGNKAAKEDAEKAFNHLDNLIKLSATHDISYSTYKCWFEYAKYMCVSLTRAYNVALEWKDKELSRIKSNDPYKNKLFKPYYYLYVITLLRYVANQGVTEEEVRQRRNDLSRQIRVTSRETSTVQDWFSSRPGLGQLYDRSWTSLGMVDMDSNIREVEGIVVFYGQNNNGYIRIINPRAISSWGCIPNNQAFSVDSDVFFSLGATGILSESDFGSGKTKKLKFGFSYEKMVASRNSLEKNRKESVVIEEKKIAAEPPTVKEVSCERKVIPQAKLQKREKVKFIPYDSVFADSKQSYLKGTLPNGNQGRIDETDIALFGDDINSYGSASDVLKELSKLKCFDVEVLEHNGNNWCKISLFETGTKLSEILPQLNTTAEAETDDKNEECEVILPDLKGKIFVLKECEFGNGSSISGKIEYSGKLYAAIIPSVQNKTRKALQKQHFANKRINVKVKSVNEDVYIVSLQ